MTYFSSYSARSLTRRAFAIFGLLLCLSMATTNLVGAFASNIPVGENVSVAADLNQALGNRKKTVVVTLVSNGIKEKTIEQIQSTLGVTVHNELNELPIISIENIGIKDIDTLISIPGIIGIEPIREFTTGGVDYLEAINALGIIDPTTSAPNQKTLDGTGSIIGIIDSGINANHVQFKKGNTNRVIAQACVDQMEVDIAPCSKTPGQAAQINCDSQLGSCYHGHAVAGFAAGGFTQLEYNDGSGFVDIQGAAPNADISYFRIADSDKNGPTNLSLLAGFNKFLGDKRNNPSIAPDVINLSIGWEYEDIPSCGYYSSLKLAIDTVVNSGIAVVVASGNNANKVHIASPACLESVISVGATEFEKDSTGKIIGEKVAGFSNSSPELDLVAPGTNLIGSTPSDQYFSMSGTSFASPIVAGAIALIKQAKPDLSPAQVKSLLISTADQVKEPANGKTFPRINVKRAISTLSTVPGTTTTSPVSTTAPATTTTSITPTSSSTTTTLVSGTTSVPITTTTLIIGTSAPAPSTVVPTTDVEVVVAGQTVTRTSAEPTLPFTGSSTTQLFFAAVWILLAGAMLLCFKEGFTQRAMVKVRSKR